MGRNLEPAFFYLEKDNVLFRGLDSGNEFDGYACPLFDFEMSRTVARYLTTDSLNIIFEPELRTFVILCGARKTPLNCVAVNNHPFFYFGGWPWIKEELKKRTDDA